MTVRFPAAVLAAALLAGAVTQAPIASAQTAADDVRKEARERFDRGLRLFNQGDNPGALAEFLRAYELVPHPMVLFNLALVHAAVNDPVKAVEAADRLLADPGKLGAERSKRVLALRGEQLARIGEIEITVNVAGASVEVDGVEVAKAPLAEPVKVPVGSHVVSIVSPGYLPVRRQVTVAGQAKATVNVELQALEGRLAHLEVVVSIPEAEVVVDDIVVGESPLPASLALAPGNHTLEVRRPGYKTVRQTMTLGDGAAGKVEIALEEDASALGAQGGSLALDLSEEDAVIFVDGAARGPYSGPMRLPEGRHRLRVERADFITYEREVVVKQGGTTILPIELQPTADYRADYRASAKRRRIGSGIGIGVGGAMLAAGAIFLPINKADEKDKKKAFDAEAVRQGPGGECERGTTTESCNIELLNIRLKALEDARDLEKFGWLGIGIGGAAAITSLVIMLTGNDPDRYEPKAESDVFAKHDIKPVGWVSRDSGGFSLVGHF